MAHPTAQQPSAQKARTLSFGLSLVQHKGIVTLTQPLVSGLVSLDQLEMMIPEITFPFDLSGGASRFRHRRCHLQACSFGCSRISAQQWLDQRTEFRHAGFHNLRLFIESPLFGLTGIFNTGETSAQLVIRGFFLPAGDRQIQISLCDIRLYGALQWSAPQVASLLLHAAGASSDPSAEFVLVGCCDAVLDPLGMILLSTLPHGGWRLPRLTQTCLRKVDLKSDQLKLSFTLDHEGFPEEEQTIPTLPPRLIAHQEGKQRFSEAERLIHQSPQAAIEIFRNHLKTDSSVLFVNERLLQLLCADPARTEETLQLVRSVRAQHPDFIPAHLAEATVCVRRHQWSLAARCYRQIADLCKQQDSPTEELVASMTAGQCAMMADPETARGDFERVLQLDESNELALVQLARLYADGGVWHKLVEVRHRQLALTSASEGRFHTHLALGEIYRVHLSDSENAREQYELALECEPKCEPALKGLAEACIDVDDPKRAIQALDDLRLIMSERGDLEGAAALHLRIASLWEHLDDPASALANVDQALEMRSSDPQTLQRRAALLVATGSTSQAVETLRQLLPILSDPMSKVDVHRQLAELLLSLDQPGESQHQVELAQALLPNDPTTTELALKVAERVDDPNALVAALDQAISTEHDMQRSIELLTRRAEVLAEQDGRMNEAAASLHQAMRAGLQEDQAERVWDGIIERQKDRRGLSAAAQTAQAAAATFIEPKRKAERYFAAGQLWQKQSSSIEEAIRCFKAAISCWPQHASALNALDAHSTSSDDPDTLIQVLELKIEAETDNPTEQLALLMRLGRHLIDLGRWAEANDIYNRVLSLDSDNIEALLFVARQAHQQGQVHHADSAYQRVADALERLDGDLSEEDRSKWALETHLRLAGLSRQQGKTQQEERHLEIVLASNPEHQQVLQRLDELLTSQNRSAELVDVLRRRFEVSEDPQTSTSLQFRLASLLESLPGCLDESVDVYRQVLELQPTHEGALMHLMLILRKTRRFDELIDVLVQRAELIEEARPAAELLLEAARLATTHLNDDERAKSLLQRAHHRCPEDPEVLDTLLQNSEHPEAHKDLDPAILHRVAFAHSEAGQKEQAIRALRVSLGLFSERHMRARVARDLIALATDLSYEQDRLTALRILRQEDATPNELWQLAKLLAENEEEDDAIHILKQLPSDFSPSEEARQLLWHLLESQQRYEELAHQQEQHAQQATDLSQQTDALLAAARTWAAQVGNMDRARQLLFEATGRQPIDLDLVDRLGQLLDDVGASDEFITIVQQLASPDGPHTAGLQARILSRAAGFLHATAAQWQTVEANYQQALERDPNCTEAMEGMILLYEQREDHRNLVTALVRRGARGSDVDRRVEALLRASAILNENLQRPQDALTILQRARELRPDDPRIVEAMADVYLILRKPARAEEVLVALADLGGSQTDQALERSCSLARMRGDTEAEARYLTKLARVKPNDGQITTRLIEALRSVGDPRSLAAAIQPLAENNNELLFELSQLYAGPLEDLSSAQDTLSRLLEKQPDHRAGLISMIQILEQRGRPLETASYLRRLLPLEAGNQRRAALAEKLARLEQQSENLSSAEDAWRQALVISPLDPDLICALADNLSRQEKWEDLCILLEEKLAKEGLSIRAQGKLATLLGEAYIDHLSDAQAAIQWLEKACSLSVHNAQAFRRLMDICRQREDYGALASLLEKRVPQLKGKERVALLEELGYLQEVHLKDLAGAAAAYTAAFREDEDRLNCALRAQELYERTGKLDEALNVVDQIITRVSDVMRGELHASRARILASKGLMQQSNEEYELALKYNPRLHTARAELGRQLFGVGKFAEAIPYLRTAIELLSNPKEKASCESLANLALKKLGLSPEAPSVSEEAPPTPAPTPETPTPAPSPPTQTPETASPPTQTPEAASPVRSPTVTPFSPPSELGALGPPAWERVTPTPSTGERMAPPPPASTPVPEPDPQELPPSQDWQQVADDYKAQVSRSNDPVARADKLMKAARVTERQLSRPLEAIILYEEAVTIAPSYIPALEALADAAYRNQDWHKARELYDRLAKEGGATLPPAEISYRRALVHETLGDDATADACYAQAVDINPKHRAALEGRARVALWRDDVQTAIAAFTGLVNQISVNELEQLTATREKLGELHLLAGNLEKAKEYLEETLAQHPQHKKVMQTLINVYQHLGEYREMAELLDRLNRLTTNPLVRASLLHYRAEILGMELGDEEAAIDCLLRAYDLAPNYPPTLWRLIDYYWEKNDLESVAEMGLHLMDSTDLEKESPDIRHIRLAAAMLLARDDPETATRLLRVALTIDDLLTPVLHELGRTVSMGASPSKLAQLIRDADSQGNLRKQAPRILKASPKTPGITEIVDKLTSLT